MSLYVPSLSKLFNNGYGIIFCHLCACSSDIVHDKIVLCYQDMGAEEVEMIETLVADFMSVPRL